MEVMVRRTVGDMKGWITKEMETRIAIMARIFLPIVTVRIGKMTLMEIQICEQTRGAMVPIFNIQYSNSEYVDFRSGNPIKILIGAVPIWKVTMGIVTDLIIIKDAASCSTMDMARWGRFGDVQHVG